MLLWRWYYWNALVNGGFCHLNVRLALPHSFWEPFNGFSSTDDRWNQKSPTPVGYSSLVETSNSLLYLFEWFEFNQTGASERSKFVCVSQRFTAIALSLSMANLQREIISFHVVTPTYSVEKMRINAWGFLCSNFSVWVFIGSLGQVVDMSVEQSYEGYLILFRICCIGKKLGFVFVVVQLYHPRVLPRSRFVAKTTQHNER